MRSVYVVLILVTALTAACSCSDEGASGDLRDMTVVFVGASITEAWDFGRYFPGYNFKKVIYYEADKTQAWDEVAAYDPDIVVVKECAAYFNAGGGTPLAEYENVMKSMVALARNAGATPVLATTIPVDVGVGDCTQEQLDDIIAFNGWVRNYCAQNGVALMDYYNRIADDQGQLPSDCHGGDGLHPNDHGYAVLSPIVIPVLEGAKP